MCEFFAGWVTRDRGVLWLPEQESHDDMADAFGIKDDATAFAFEYTGADFCPEYDKRPRWFTREREAAVIAEAVRIYNVLAPHYRKYASGRDEADSAWGKAYGRAEREKREQYAALSSLDPELWGKRDAISSLYNKELGQAGRKHDKSLQLASDAWLKAARNACAEAGIAIPAPTAKQEDA